MEKMLDPLSAGSIVVPDARMGGGSAPRVGMVAGCSSMEILVGLVMTMVLAYFELRRLGVIGSQHGLGSAVRWAIGPWPHLRRFAPEALGVVACIGVALVFRLVLEPRRPRSSSHDVAWAEITSEWPVLMTADSLLALQAMLRLVAFFSVAYRGAPSFVGAPAALSCGAIVARVAVAARTSVYVLDGPLGGTLPVACEVAALPLLVAAGAAGIVRRVPVEAVVVAVVAASLAVQHHLNLAGGSDADWLFALAHILELLSAATCLFRTAVSGGSGGNGGMAAGAALVLMPVQQVFAAYYFAKVFTYNEELVGAGLPYLLFYGGGIAQLGMYLMAAVLSFADFAEGAVDASRGSVFVR